MLKKAISEMVDAGTTYEVKAREALLALGKLRTDDEARAEYLCAAVVFSILHLADVTERHR